MDTYKEKQTLDEMYERGVTPWCIWSQKQPLAKLDDEPSRVAVNGKPR